jgi:hypothetical protein
LLFFANNVTSAFCSRWNEMFSTLRNKWKGSALSLASRSLNLNYNFAEIPFQKEAYSDGNVETETIGNTQVLLTLLYLVEDSCTCHAICNLL